MEDFIAFNRKTALHLIFKDERNKNHAGWFSGRSNRLAERTLCGLSEGNGYTDSFPRKLNKMVRIAHDNGYQVAVHAIGDKAADIVADAYIAALKENPRNDHRHGIVHFQITDDDLLKK